jgi:hypothetical protein
MLQIVYQCLFTLENLVFLATVVVGWTHRKNRELQPIRYYLLESTVSILLTLVIMFSKSLRKYYYPESHFFALLDLTIWYYYFGSLLMKRNSRKILVACYLLILGIAAYYLFGILKGYEKINPTLFGLENLFITIPCFFYFYELFKSEEPVDLRNNPHFLIACAVIFFYSTTFPFYMTYETFYEVTPNLLHSLNAVEHVLLIIYDFVIIKAFLCPYPEQK